MNTNPSSMIPGADRAMTAGAQALVGREVTLAMLRYQRADQKPRDERVVLDLAVREASHLGEAEAAAYEFAKGGNDINGISIRGAETLARLWGNLGFGFEIMSVATAADGVDVSELRAFAIDYQTGADREVRFPCRHFRHTRQGGYKLTDDRDVTERQASLAQRAVRTCIAALLPRSLKQGYLDQAEATLLAHVDMTPEGRTKLLAAFAAEPFRVTKVQIEKFIQRDFDRITPRQVVRLKRVYAALRDGVAAPGTFFEGAETERQSASSKVNQAMRRAAGPASTPDKSPQPSEPSSSAKTPGTPGKVDVADVLRRIRAAGDFDELRLEQERVQAIPEGDDRALLEEALGHREQYLSEGLDDAQGQRRPPEDVDPQPWTTS